MTVSPNQIIIIIIINTGHATIAAPTGCLVVVDDQNYVVVYKQYNLYIPSLHDELAHPRI